MLVHRSDKGEILAVGIASFGYASCNEEKTSPSVFMKVASYLEFIEQNTDLIVD